MKVFITGIAGFIGSHLAKKLEAEGHEVKGIDNLSHPSFNRVRFNWGDVRYRADVEEGIKWADVVCHLAAQIHVDKSITNPQETIDINVSGTLNILEACRKYNKRLVFASTSEVYGSSQSELMQETHQLDAQSPYGASKAAADRLCKSYYYTYGLDVRILRNFNIFGPFQNDTSYGGVIAIFTKAALEGKPLNIFGDGTQERDYMYIDDALSAYELVAFADGLDGEVLNAGTGKTVTISDLAESIKAFAVSDSEINHIDPRPGEVQRLCADITKIKELGFEPATNFKECLRAYVDWYKKTFI